MADKPNNFGEVLFKALGNTVEGAPSIFNDAKLRKKAESMQMLDAILKLQDANTQGQRMRMAQEEQATQQKTAALNQQWLTAQILEKQQELADPFPEWKKKKIAYEEQIKTDNAIRQANATLKYAIDLGRTKSGGLPGGANIGGIKPSLMLSAANQLDNALTGELKNARTLAAAQAGAKSPGELGAMAQAPDFNIFNLLTGQTGANPEDSANFSQYQRTFTPPFIDSTRQALAQSHPDLYNIATSILQGGTMTSPPKTIAPFTEEENKQGRALADDWDSETPELKDQLLRAKGIRK